MHDFAKKITIREIEHIFLFTKVEIPGTHKYFISACRKENDPVFFEMVIDEQGRWLLMPPVPDWISTLKETIITMIMREEFY